MSSYRFCRTDDVELLVRAYNRCYRVHFPELPEMTVEEFRRRIRAIDLWCSSCMVAAVSGEPVAVLLAAKRERENLIHAIGTHPDHRRQGHARHLLTSLGAKLAILGPPRLLAEVPAEWTEAGALFEACGYRRERTYVDFVSPPDLDRGGAAAATGASGGAAGTTPSADGIIPVGVDDLQAAGALDDGVERCWERAPRSLAARKERLAGLALATDRFEAWLLQAPLEGGAGREIVAFGCADPARREPLFALLLAHLRGSHPGPLCLPRVWEGELPFALLERQGFRRDREYAGYVAVAQPG